MKFEIVKLYFNDMYEGWCTGLVEEADKSNHYEEGYFIKVDGLYFMLGTSTGSYCVDGE